MNFLIEAIGWALLHFLWQGTAVAVVLFALLAALRRHTAQTRYLLSAIGMIAMVALFTTTLLVNLSHRSDHQHASPAAAAAPQPAPLELALAATATTEQPAPPPTAPPAPAAAPR